MAQRIKETPLAPYTGLLDGMTREQKMIVVTYITKSMEKPAAKAKSNAEIILRSSYAEHILALGAQGMIELYASYLSYANMGYILRHHPVAEIYSLIRMMRQPVEVPCSCPS